MGSKGFKMPGGDCSLQEDKSKRIKEIGQQNLEYAAQDHNVPLGLLLQRQLSLY